MEGSHTSFFMQHHQGLGPIPQVPPTPALPATSPGLPSLVSHHGHSTGGRSVAAHGLHLLPCRAHATWRNQETGAIPTRNEGGLHSQPGVYMVLTCPQGPESAAQQKDPGASQASGAPAQSHSLGPGCSLTSRTDRHTSHRQTPPVLENGGWSFGQSLPVRDCRVSACYLSSTPLT